MPAMAPDKETKAQPRWWDLDDEHQPRGIIEIKKFDSRWSLVRQDVRELESYQLHYTSLLPDLRSGNDISTNAIQLAEAMPY